jgi:hypothetical protein
MTVLYLDPGRIKMFSSVCLALRGIGVRARC